jgi:hypothetical protein
MPRAQALLSPKRRLPNPKWQTLACSPGTIFVRTFFLASSSSLCLANGVFLRVTEKDVFMLAVPLSTATQAKATALELGLAWLL